MSARLYVIYSNQKQKDRLEKHEDQYGYTVVDRLIKMILYPVLLYYFVMQNNLCFHLWINEPVDEAFEDKCNAGVDYLFTPLGSRGLYACLAELSKY